tara:strand:- start:2481 stop:3590 length:1110 start_codon:yes stop_codon:yes gene_type:complete
MDKYSGELLEFIGEIYQAGLTGKWLSVLNKLIDITQSNKAFFFLQELDNDQPLIMELQTTFEYPQSALLDYQSRPFKCPCYQSTEFLTEGDSINVNKHIDLTQHRNSSFFQNIYGPLKVFHSVVGVLCRDTHYESVFMVNRDENDQPYQHKDEELFRIITPHFSRAMHIYKELRLYKNYSNISKSILDQQGKAIIVCDAYGQVMIINDYANQRLDTSCPITLLGNKLFIKNAIYQQRLMSCIRKCATHAYKETGEQETLIVEDGNNENILLTIAPPKNENILNDIDVPCCIITINFQRQWNWLKISDLFALTPKEMRLLKALYAKKKLMDLPHVYNVSYNTLRTQLQAIFKKVEVSSQSELMIKINLFI